MAKVTTPRKIETIKYFENTVEIFKSTKVGTKSNYYFPQTADGKRISRTMFARKYDALSLGRKFLRTATEKA